MELKAEGNFVMFLEEAFARASVVARPWSVRAAMLPSQLCDVFCRKPSIVLLLLLTGVGG